MLRSAGSIEARSVYEGRIERIDRGNADATVVIDHGGGYRSTVSGLTTVSVRVGEEIPGLFPLGSASGRTQGAEIRISLDKQGRALSAPDWFGI